MTVLVSALAFLILLTFLILIHEFGHFAVARRVGVVVEEFGFGLPPRARTLFRHKGTNFTLNWVPFGGFVRLKGETATTQHDLSAPGSFHRASFSGRIAILIAGVFMNFLLALVLLTVGFSVGRWVPTYFSLEEMKADGKSGVIELQLGVMIEKVLSGGSAAKAGVPERSILASIDGQALAEADEVASLQEGKRRVTYEVLTGTGFLTKQTFTLTLEDGKSGVVVTTYPRHVAAPLRSVGSAFLLALREARVMTVQTVIGIGHLFSSLAQTGKVPEGITGIVGIAQLTHASVLAGFMTYLRLVALISLSLAVLNILPFPALDGGRVLFVLAEAVVRRPLNQRFELVTNAIGLSVLIFLIVLITFYDIIRLF
ncbi:MAG: M50 family metallopeptidase [Candidatus Peribacteraceae bacterium]|nr:M50 family metallopeptidase [Candidatus Peribacteraceae bacterium]